jgi:hypothetical protein
MQQLTIEQEIDRQSRIARLARSMERWRKQELDRILPEDYAYYCALLDYLRGGGAYTVRRVTPEALFAMSKEERKADPVGQMFRDIGAGLASVSRATIRPRAGRV